MKFKLQITEGCTCYSYTINDMEYDDLLDKQDEYYNPELVYNTLQVMVKDLELQCPNEMAFELIDSIIAYHRLSELRWLFEFLFHENKNTKCIDSWTCDECFDTVTVRELIIEAETQNILEIINP